MKKNLLLLFFITTSVFAIQTEDRVIKPNYIVEYLKVPGEVENLSDILSHSRLYGRLRSNSFGYEYKHDGDAYKDHFKSGIGGSITLKTPFYYGFGATTGFYGSIPLGSSNTIESTNLNYTRSGKDLFRTREDGSEADIGVLAVAYGQYKRSCLDITLGRQIIETALLGSNDSKMIPNTFEGIFTKGYFLPDTTLQAGYITAQKLRDHQNFHSIIAFERLTQNDDGNNHKGLSVTNLQKMGKEINPEMILASIENKSLTNSRLYGEYGAISGYFSTLILEGSHTLQLDSSWKLIPTLRYIRQFDDGAGAVGGAALSGVFASGGSNNTSYTHPNSVDGQLYTGKLQLTNGTAMGLFGYSHVSNEADIINPWRSFPTRGFDRVMAQNNWYANTDSWMIEGDYNLDKAGIISGLSCNIRYSHIDIDDEKSQTASILSTDRDIIYFHAIKTFKSIPDTEVRFRFADVNAKDYPITNANDSYQEYRFEINYLF
jgi:hypothetical protein